jgi:hypothetical protein
MDAATAGLIAQVGGGLLAGMGADSAGSDMGAAALRAADMARFDPYGVTTGNAKAIFDTDAKTATYELTPEMQARRDRMYGLSDEQLAAINLDTSQNALDYYNQQQGLMSGGRTAEDIALRQSQLAGGRIGLGLSGAAVGAGAGTGYVNPEQYQRDLARAQADAQLSALADERARSILDQDIARGQGFFNFGQGIEQLGIDTMNLGADYGKASAQAGANAGQLLLGGQKNTADYNLAGDLNRAGMFQQFGTGLINNSSQGGGNMPFNLTFDGGSNSYGDTGSIWGNPIYSP